MDKEKGGNSQSSGIIPYPWVYGETPDYAGTQTNLQGQREGATGNATVRLKDLKEVRKGLFSRPVTGTGHLIRVIICENIGLFTGWFYIKSLAWGLTGNLLIAPVFVTFLWIFIIFAVRSIQEANKKQLDFNFHCTIALAIGILLGYLAK